MMVIDMDDEKRGKFLQQLRNEKKLTQKQLGEILHYSDNAISNWEKGKTLPNNPEALIKLSEFYGVSIEELLYGERKTQSNSKKISKHMENLYKKNYTYLKKSIIAIIFLILILIIISMISIYFIFIKGKILSYTIQGQSEHFYLEKSSILFTSEIDILNLNKIETNNDQEIVLIKMYYNDSNGEHIILVGPNDDYYIEEPNYSTQYNLDAFRSKKIYLEVTYNDNLTETMELTTSRKYINDKIYNS